MTLFQFGDSPRYELHVRARRLLADGVEVTIGSRALDVLIYLVERAGHVVSRRQLLESVWASVVIESNSLNAQMMAVRRVLGSGAVRTVVGRGYTFVPTVTRREGLDAAPKRLSRAPQGAMPPLYGRKQEFDLVESLLKDSVPVTLVGAGGIGKTLLARHLLRHLGERTRNGGCFIDLCAIVEPGAVPGAIAAALGIEPVDGDPLKGLVKAFESLDVLLVLDNAEHLLEAVASTVALLGGFPRARVLVTSQAPLNLAAERVVPLGPLEVPSELVPVRDLGRIGAVALFVSRARFGDPAFELTEANAGHIVEICRLLDGSPLAIELAARQAPALGLAQLRSAMDDQLRMLAAESPDRPPRLRSVRAALSWSYSLLDERSRAVFRRMSLFCSPVGLDLVAELMVDGSPEIPDDWAVRDTIRSLTDRSLLVRVADEAGDEVRYRMLVAPLQFAREQLRASGEEAAFAARHAVVMSSRFARATESMLAGRSGRQAWMERHSLELPEALEAMGRLEADGDLTRLPAMLAGIIHAAPHEARETARRAIQAAVSVAGRVPHCEETLHALLAAAFRSALDKDIGGVSIADQALEMAVALRLEGRLDERWLYWAHCARASLLLLASRIEEAEVDMRAAQSIEHPDWPAILRSRHANNELWLADRRSDREGMYVKSITYAALCEEAGFWPWQRAVVLTYGASAAERWDEAFQHAEEALEGLAGSPYTKRLANLHLQAMLALTRLGRLDEALRYSRAVWPLVGPVGLLFLWLDHQALLSAQRGDAEAAALLQGRADAEWRKQNWPRTHSEITANADTLALVDAAIGPGERRLLVLRGALLAPGEIEKLAFRDA